MSARFLPSPRTQTLGTLAGFTIYLVDGEKVRSKHVGFTMGDNEAHSPDFVPSGEVWIDNAMSNLDTYATLLHELVETPLMARGMSYDDAHEVANAAETKFRRTYAGKRVGLGEVERALTRSHG